MGCERAAERDDPLYFVGKNLRELARVDAAETPPDQAHLAPAPPRDFADALYHALGDAVAQAVIASLPPAAYSVTMVRKKGS